MISNHIRSNAIGYVALFVALAGTAWAGARIESNDIEKNAIRSKHIKQGQVKSVDVADDSLTGADIDEGSLAELGGGGGEAPVQAGPPAGPAGGDLTGTYPNPELAAGAVGSTEVADESLTGADIDEAGLTGLDAETLAGTRTDFVFDVVPPATSEFETLLDMPGVGQIRGKCATGTSGAIDFLNQSGHLLTVWVESGGVQPIASTPNNGGDTPDHLTTDSDFSMWQIGDPITGSVAATVFVASSGGPVQCAYSVRAFWST